MDEFWAGLVGAAVGAFFSGLAGAGVAIFTIWWGNQAAQKQKAEILCRNLVAEIEMLLEAIKRIVNPEVPPVAAMATLGALKVQVYPAMILDVGVLGKELAGQVVFFHAHLEFLRARGVEIESEYNDPRHLPGIDADAKAWIDQLRGTIAGFDDMLAKLKSGQE